MSRTKYLDVEALNKLRTSLRKKFLQRNPGRKAVPATTYKEAYEDLRDDIILVVPQAAQSVSLTRLRKLFYYTDPAACDAVHLENASFGRDFLEALEMYLAPTRSKKLPASSYRWAVVAITVCTTGLVFMVASDPATASGPDEHFNDTDPSRLKRAGWEILDFDPVSWRRQPKPGMLALYTAPGDYWVKPAEPRRITNLPVHPLPDENTDVSTRLVGFYPMQNHQQAGFILFNKDKSRLQHMRVTYGFSGPFPDDTRAARPNGILGFQEIVLIHADPKGDVIQHSFPLAQVAAGSHHPAMDTVYLRLALRGKKCSVYYKTGFAWNQYSLITTAELDFTPAYIGLAAFQGWTRDDHTPKGADTIPAFFDWVTFTSVR